MTGGASGGEDFPFWSFSLDLYARPGVAPACLALQDRFGCDVNILLFALWAARCGKALARADFVALEAAVASWRGGAVEPIRALRRALKADALGAAPVSTEQVRAKLLEAELQGEKAAQEMLARAVFLPSPGEGAVDPALAGGNLAAYLGWRKVGAEEARRLAETLLSAL
ncbi:MAG TPA: TIGR02444 family protein [Alphaproteobacteria bacterium]|nr:TIGR02444 family protein [Alphaproteobacteria bacterium]